MTINPDHMCNQLRRKSVCFLYLCMFLLFFTHIGFSNERAEAIQTTRVALEKWVETQRIISQEKRDHALSLEMLNERIELIEREIKALQEKISDTEKSIAEADKKRADMVKDNEKLKEVSLALDETLVKLEGRTKQLLSKLPDPIRERIKPLSQQLPEKDKEVKLSNAQRFQNVVGILNEVDKYNREISVTSEVQTLDNGNSIEVTALYVGLGQGYYTSADETYAGVGVALEQGWTWKPYNQAARQIAEAVSIMKNEKPASYVMLPVEIQQ